MNNHEQTVLVAVTMTEPTWNIYDERGRQTDAQRDLKIRQHAMQGMHSLLGAGETKHHYQAEIRHRQQLSEHLASKAVALDESLLRKIEAAAAEHRPELPGLDLGAVLEVVLRIGRIAGPMSGQTLSLLERIPPYQTANRVPEPLRQAVFRQRDNGRTGYRRHEIEFTDESILEINPVPAEQPGETWLWAVCYDTAGDRAVLVQGNTNGMLWELCVHAALNENQSEQT